MSMPEIVWLSASDENMDFGEWNAFRESEYDTRYCHESMFHDEKNRLTVLLTASQQENAELREKVENDAANAELWRGVSRDLTTALNNANDKCNTLRTANAELTRKVGELRKYTAEILPGLEACGKHGNLINAIHRYLEVTKP